MLAVVFPNARTVRAPSQRVLLLLTATAFLIHGYHPFAEDGGLYAAGIKLYVHPSLFAHDRAFVAARRAYSLFDPVIGSLTLWLHRPLEEVLLCAHLLCLYLTLVAIARLAAMCFATPKAPLYAAALTAVACTVPVAGTSLFFMEPYLTARSFSTPLTLLAISLLSPAPAAAFPKRRFAAGITVLAMATLLHVAMSAYAALFLLTLWTFCIPRPRFRWATQAALLVALLLACALVQRQAPLESAAALAAAHTRTFWFLSRWQWYELAGLAAPLLIFAGVLLSTATSFTVAGRTIFKTACCFGASAVLVSLVFARWGQTPFPVARLQPLRAFHILYGLLLVLLGAFAAAWAGAPAHFRRWGVATLLVSIGVAMLLAQRATFPASPHLEWPEAHRANSWSEAFLWARQNTPADALFALDADYITTDGEDAQNFRATAERSMVSDFSKDGGAASIRPQLAPEWLLGSTLTRGLSEQSDAERRAHLLPLGVTWLVLHASATSATACPFDNGTVKVCPISSPPEPLPLPPEPLRP